MQRPKPHPKPSHGELHLPADRLSATSKARHSDRLRRRQSEGGSAFTCRRQSVNFRSSKCYSGTKLSSRRGGALK